MDQYGRRSFRDIKNRRQQCCQRTGNAVDIGSPGIAGAVTANINPFEQIAYDDRKWYGSQQVRANDIKYRFNHFASQ